MALACPLMYPKSNRLGFKRRPFFPQGYCMHFHYHYYCAHCYFVNAGISNPTCLFAKSNMSVNGKIHVHGAKVKIPPSRRASKGTLLPTPNALGASVNIRMAWILLLTRQWWWCGSTCRGCACWIWVTHGGRWGWGYMRGIWIHTCVILPECCCCGIKNTNRKGSTWHCSKRHLVLGHALGQCQTSSAVCTHSWLCANCRKSNCNRNSPGDDDKRTRFRDRCNDWQSRLVLLVDSSISTTGELLLLLSEYRCLQWLPIFGVCSSVCCCCCCCMITCCWCCCIVAFQ